MWHLFPDLGSNPGSLQWEGGVLATGPPWKSLTLATLSLEHTKSGFTSGSSHLWFLLPGRHLLSQFCVTHSLISFRRQIECHLYERDLLWLLCLKQPWHCPLPPWATPSQCYCLLLMTSLQYFLPSEHTCLLSASPLECKLQEGRVLFISFPKAQNGVSDTWWKLK